MRNHCVRAEPRQPETDPDHHVAQDEQEVPAITDDGQRWELHQCTGLCGGQARLHH